jgi:hypothetical protein
VHLSGKWYYLAAGATAQPKELHCAVNQVTCVAMVTDKQQCFTTCIVSAKHYQASDKTDIVTSDIVHFERLCSRHYR